MAHPVLDHASFWTQADALLRKNLTFQVFTPLYMCVCAFICLSSLLLGLTTSTRYLQPYRAIFLISFTTVKEDLMLKSVDVLIRDLTIHIYVCMYLHKCMRVCKNLANDIL